jgi:protease-4
VSGPAIAIIEVNGTIVSGSAGGSYASAGLAGADDVIQAIRFADQDPDVEAILLKVNSPGGSVVASDLIYQELAATTKPIVVLMGELTASGGYYISMAGDHLIANPNSLTGSIGVISTFPNAEALFENVGLEFTVFTSGEAKDFGSLYRDMTPEEIEYWQAVIDETYEGFVQIVVDGRGLPIEQVRAVADGRVFTGRQALELGLIDEIGYEHDALKKAASLGGIQGPVRVIRFGTDEGLFSILGGLSPAGSQLLPRDFLDRMLMPRLEFRWLP